MSSNEERIWGSFLDTNKILILWATINEERIWEYKSFLDKNKILTPIDND